MDRLERFLFLLAGSPLRRAASDLVILLVCVCIPWWVTGELDPWTGWVLLTLAGIYVVGEIAIVAARRRQARR
jgi:hypothetical protein